MSLYLAHALAVGQPSASLGERARGVFGGEIPRSTSRVRIGDYEFDLRAGELHLGTQRTILPGQPYEILSMLVQSLGEIVTRDEIQQRLWQGTVIVNFEVSINQAIRKLRRALNDSATNSRYIETIGRRGYRLKVPVLPLSAAPEFSGPTSPPASSAKVTAEHGYGEQVLCAAAFLGLLHMLSSFER